MHVHWWFDIIIVNLLFSKLPAASLKLFRELVKLLLVINVNRTYALMGHKS